MIFRFSLSVIALAFAAGCGGQGSTSPDNFAARVGTEYLSEADVAEALNVLPLGLDSITARQQVIEQWVHSRLLAQEARRSGLSTQDDVQRQLAESERAVLAAALVDRFFEANAEEPTDEEVQAYYDANLAELELREPYVQIRLLTTDDSARAEQGRVSMLRAQDSPFADSLWNLTAVEFAFDAEGALGLSSRYLPESRLGGIDEIVGRQSSSMETGAVSKVFNSGGRHHVLQIVSRINAGSTPELPWIRDELRQRLAIEKRNTRLAQQIQQLQNEAESDGRLEIR